MPHTGLLLPPVPCQPNSIARITVLIALLPPCCVEFLLLHWRLRTQHLPLQLLEALEWCVEVGIECVSVFAFSIDNFNRSPAEVEALMGLAQIKLQEMLQVHSLYFCILNPTSL